MEALILLLIVLGIYFLPTILAKKNKASIFIINLFFGWTLLGWVICLAWAFKN